MLRVCYFLFFFVLHYSEASVRLNGAIIPSRDTRAPLISKNHVSSLRPESPRNLQSINDVNIQGSYLRQLQNVNNGLTSLGGNSLNLVADRLNSLLSEDRLNSLLSDGSLLTNVQRNLNGFASGILGTLPGGLISTVENSGNSISNLASSIRPDQIIESLSRALTGLPNSDEIIMRLKSVLSPLSAENGGINISSLNQIMERFVKSLSNLPNANEIMSRLENVIRNPTNLLEQIGGTAASVPGLNQLLEAFSKVVSNVPNSDEVMRRLNNVLKPLENNGSILPTGEDLLQRFSQALSGIPNANEIISRLQNAALNPANVLGNASDRVSSVTSIVPGANQLMDTFSGLFSDLFNSKEVIGRLNAVLFTPLENMPTFDQLMGRFSDAISTLPNSREVMSRLNSLSLETLNPMRALETLGGRVSEFSSRIPGFDQFVDNVSRVVSDFPNSNEIMSRLSSVLNPSNFGTRVPSLDELFTRVRDSVSSLPNGQEVISRLTSINPTIANVGNRLSDIGNQFIDRLTNNPLTNLGQSSVGRVDNFITGGRRSLLANNMMGDGMVGNMVDRVGNVAAGLTNGLANGVTGNGPLLDRLSGVNLLNGNLLNGNLFNGNLVNPNGGLLINPNTGLLGNPINGLGNIAERVGNVATSVVSGSRDMVNNNLLFNNNGPFRATNSMNARPITPVGNAPLYGYNQNKMMPNNNNGGLLHNLPVVGNLLG